MPAFSLTAQSTFVSNLDTVRQNIAAAMHSAAGAAAAVVLAESQAIVPVATGALKDSLAAAVVDDGTVSTGIVSANVDYAPYVEFGTGQRGASSPGAGPGPYAAHWIGMPAQPFLRPALDSARAEAIAAFKEATS